jgi:hypothetical protein
LPGGEKENLGNPCIKLAEHGDHQSKGSTMAEKILKKIDSICYWMAR